MRSRTACWLAILASATFTSAMAADWPSYRGPQGTGRSAETGLVSAWPESGPKELWRAPLGNGYSGIAVAGGAAFTLFGDGEDEFAVALDAATGEELWRYRTDGDRPDQFGDGPRSTPTVAGGTVYALSARGKLHALAADSGRPRWSVDLAERYGAKVPTWGVSVSPLVRDDRIYLDAGGKKGHSLLALDRETGELVWASETDKPGYSTALPVTVGGVSQLVFFTGSSLVSVKAEDGALLWRVPWKTAYDVNAAMPLFVPPDQVFVSSGYDVGAALYRVAGNGGEMSAEEVWKSRVMRNQFNLGRRSMFRTHAALQNPTSSVQALGSVWQGAPDGNRPAQVASGRD